MTLQADRLPVLDTISLAHGSHSPDAGEYCAMELVAAAARAAAHPAADSAAYPAADSAAHPAAHPAADSAAHPALAPTVEVLRGSALELLDRMIDPAVKA